ncbi:polysaccharide deacetylase family protein [Snuella lapsa]|uniref:polysaccharide deacetylase family protein n=1 Tax=Snuella lapsa TaxID=870481 RepID=UPI0031F021FB
MNHYFSEKYVSNFRFRPYIQTILIHKIYKNRDELIPENGAFLEGVDISQLEAFVSYFVKRGVEFINETDILEDKLDPNKQYIYLTFDDGYYNNFRCLDILEKYKVKATFMISTNHVKEQKAFWWDILFREIKLNKGHKTDAEINNTIHSKNLMLYRMKWQDQEDFIKDNFGLRSLDPSSDVDRPMTESELRQFASHPFVTLGNHTDNHLNVTLYDADELISSIKSAENFLNSVTSQQICSVSYPHGLYNDACVNIISKLGYRIGVTVNSGRNNVSELSDTHALMRLNRVVLSGFSDIEQQCRNIHIGFSLYSHLNSLKW